MEQVLEPSFDFKNKISANVELNEVTLFPLHAVSLARTCR